MRLPWLESKAGPFRGCRVLVPNVIPFPQCSTAALLRANCGTSAAASDSQEGARLLAIYHIRVTGQYRRPEEPLCSRPSVSSTCQCFSRLHHSPGKSHFVKLAPSVVRLYSKQWALCNWQYDTIGHYPLLDHGWSQRGRRVSRQEDVWSIQLTRSRSLENVWDFISRGQIDQKHQDDLRCISSGSHWVEEQNIPLAHQIVFGMSQEYLDLELTENPLAICQTDVQGRTALNRAAARGQAWKVGILLSHGADPDSMDVTGRTTLHQALDSGSTIATRLLLEAVRIQIRSCRVASSKAILS